MATFGMRQGESVQDPPPIQALLSAPRFWRLWSKVSGYVGADYSLLRWVSTPWRGVPANTAEATAHAEALMAWADDGGQ